MEFNYILVHELIYIYFLFNLLKGQTEPPPESFIGK